MQRMHRFHRTWVVRRKAARRSALARPWQTRSRCGAMGALLSLVLISATPAWPARPFVTDDARLTTARSCQLESWMRIYPDSRELWALPACNPTGNVEVTLGGGYARTEGQPFTTDCVMQAKTLFRTLEANNWGWGLAVGTVRHPEIHPGPNQLGNTYAYIPLSASFIDDTLVVHANVGWLRDRASRQQNLTFGFGAELQITARLLAIAETFGDHRNRPYWQTGARFAIVPNRVQVDATIGKQFDGPRESRWISFGLRLTPDRLL